MQKMESIVESYEKKHYIYVYIVVKMREFRKNKVLNIVNVEL